MRARRVARAIVGLSVALAIPACDSPEPEAQAVASAVGSQGADGNWVGFTRSLAFAPGATPGRAVSPRPSKREAPGRWRLRNEPAGASAEEREMIARLEAIGYAQGSQPTVARTGVVLHDRARTQPGTSFYTSGHAAEAILTDLDGIVLHRWSHPYERAFPDRTADLSRPAAHAWRRAHLFENGDILAIHEGLGILRLDRDSNLLWARFNRAHHDLEVQEDGDVYVLTRVAHVVPEIDRRFPILEDFLSILGPGGDEKRRISLLRVLENSPDSHAWRPASEKFWSKEASRKVAAKRGQGDIFHTNSLEVLDGQRVAPGFRAGNILMSFCHLDRIAVIDPQRGRVVWALDGHTSLQHDPTITPDGGVLVFDNHWRPGTRSRAVVLDPLSGDVMWQYDGTDASPLYSKTCGSAAPLANGNVLITESDNGRALEVTRDGEIVWEFYNPHVAGEQDEFIATVFDMVRLPEDFPLDWTDASRGAPPPP